MDQKVPLVTMASPRSKASSSPMSPRSSTTSSTIDAADFDPLADPQFYRLSADADMEKSSGPAFLRFQQTRPRRPWILLLLRYLGTALVVGIGLYVLSFYGQDDYFATPLVYPLEGPTRALIIASTKDQDLGWLNQIPRDWKVYRYVADDPDAELPVPRNQGQEVMAYLTYIIDHYDDLPDYMVFVHGHEKAWHQPPPMQWLLQSMDMDVVERNGWLSLRCSNWGRCEGPGMYTHPREGDWAMAVALRGIHNYTYRPEDPWYEELPEDIAVACCAQFAVSRTQTLTKPREFWVRLREPLLSDNLEADFASWDPADAEGTLSWRIGATFEFAWHWFFGMEPVYCPTETFCTKHLFQDMIQCDAKTLGPPESWDTWQNINCTYGNPNDGPVLEVSLPVKPAPDQVDPAQLEDV